MENKEFYSIFPELGHEVFEKSLELYSHSNVICMNSLNTVIANAIEKSKLTTRNVLTSDPLISSLDRHNG
jgi:hypothetical protein